VNIASGNPVALRQIVLAAADCLGARERVSSMPPPRRTTSRLSSSQIGAGSPTNLVGVQKLIWRPAWRRQCSTGNNGLRDDKGDSMSCL